VALGLIAARYVGEMGLAELILLLLASPLSFPILTGAHLLAKAIWARWRRRPRLTWADAARSAMSTATSLGFIDSVHGVLWLSWEQLTALNGRFPLLAPAVIGGGLGLLWGLLEGWWVSRFMPVIRRAAARAGGQDTEL
jgi:hypothetical protein